MRMLMIDNYDSFTFNLVQLFSELDIAVEVFRNDQITLDQIETRSPDWICISPGPKAPAQAGVSKTVVGHFSGKIPILGVCLGMQVINEVFGGFTRKAPVPMHGKQSLLHHEAAGLFENLPTPFPVARYHSLCVDIRSKDLLTTGVAEDGVVMAIQHRLLPVYGVQFHPESFLSACGLEIARSFLTVHERWRPSRRSAEKSQDRFPRYEDRRQDRFHGTSGKAA
ncbi:MAG: aminodeoxychorismate/anthranilate synthase component II [Syntrophobacteraceae bacterium]